MRASLARRLKSETRALHARAERAGIMRDLVRGELARGAYCSLLRNLYEIYAALEGSLARHAKHPCVSPVRIPELKRREALAGDLSTLHGERWASEVGIAPACARYVRRLRKLAAGRPELLVAHAYVRYLGDLNGGRVLRRIVVRALALDEDRGTQFYTFAGVVDATVLARQFRSALDALPVDRMLADRIVAEAKLAFELHLRLFEALAKDASAADAVSA